jgi:hypothetical protein
LDINVTAQQTDWMKCRTFFFLEEEEEEEDS